MPSLSAILRMALISVTAAAAAAALEPRSNTGCLDGCADQACNEFTGNIRRCNSIALGGDAADCAFVCAPSAAGSGSNHCVSPRSGV